MSDLGSSDWLHIVVSLGSVGQLNLGEYSIVTPFPKMSRKFDFRRISLLGSRRISAASCYSRKLQFLTLIDSGDLDFSTQPNPLKLQESKLRSSPSCTQSWNRSYSPQVGSLIGPALDVILPPFGFLNFISKVQSSKITFSFECTWMQLRILSWASALASGWADRPRLLTLPALSSYTLLLPKA